MKKKNFPILPSAKNIIGILGGGQLGKMTAMAATKLGFETYLYCQKGDNPAEEVVSKVYHGSWDDLEKIDHFASKIVCATSEFENVPSTVLDRISKKTNVFPNATAFKNAQNRDREKKLATQAGFKVPKWYKVDTLKDLTILLHEFNVMNSRNGAHDESPKNRVRTVVSVSKRKSKRCHIYILFYT